MGHGPQRLLNILHQESKGIDGPLDDPGGIQGCWRMEEPQVLQRRYLLNHHTLK